MSSRARVIFILIGVVAFLIFEAAIGRGRSDTQVEFDEVVDRYLKGGIPQQVTIQVRRGGSALRVAGSTENSEEVLRILGQMSAADIFSKGSAHSVADSFQFSVDIGGGVREFSVWVPQREIDGDLRARNLVRLIQLLGHEG